MATFVLIHGAWHDGSAWDAVRKHLLHNGFHVFTPTITGHGKDVAKDVSHTACVHSIINYIVDQNLEDFVLVGHSFGGSIIARVAEELPHRIRRLVFQNGFVVAPGNSVLDESPPEHREMFQYLAQQSSDTSVSLPFSIWRELFINDVDLATAQHTYNALSSEPYRAFTDKLAMTRFYELDIPRSYINCTEDIALPHGEWAWHPRMSSRLRLCRLIQMPGSHEVMFSNPQGLAEKLIAAGRD